MSKIVLSSVQKTSASALTNDFRVRTKDVVPAGRYAIRVVEIGNSVPNVNSSANIIPTSLGNATVASGFYDSVSAFESACSTALTAVDASLSISISTTTYKTTISYTSNFSMDFASTSNTLFRHLGFTNTLYSGASSYTSEGILNLAITSPAQWFLNINRITELVSGDYEYTASIPMYASRLQVLRYEPIGFIQGITIDKPTRDFHIELRDENYNLIDVGTTDMTIVLEKMI